jgi:hypothetical protein
VLSRVPVHYFALVRLLPIYRRVGRSPELRGPFVRNMPRLIAAEWTLGFSALRYALRRPPLRGQGDGGFR